MKYFLTFIAHFVVCVTLYGQQRPHFQSTALYPFLTNPAYQGLQDYSEFITAHQQQWVELPDAPYTQIMAVSTPVSDSTWGLGISVMNDVAHLFHTNEAKVSLSYKMLINNKVSLSAGVGVGSFLHRIQFENIVAINPDETILSANNSSNVRFDADVGIRMQSKKVEIGFSTQNILGNGVKLKRTDGQEIFTYKVIQNYLLNALYRYNASNKIAIVPTLLLNSAQGQNPLLETMANIHYDKRFWLGLGYGSQGTVIGHLSATLDDRLSIHYYYGHSTQSLQQVSFGSHEIMIHYRFGKRETKEVLDVTKDIDRISHENEEQYEMIDQLSDKHQGLIDKTIQLEEKTDNIQKDVNQNKEEIERLKKIIEANKESSDRFFQEENVPVNNVVNPMIKNEQEDVDTIVRIPDEGITHLHHYVVVGSFDKISEAKFYQQILKREYSLDTRIISSRRNLRILVYTILSNQKEELEKEIHRLVKMDKNQLLQREPWLYRAK